MSGPAARDPVERSWVLVGNMQEDGSTLLHACRPTRGQPAQVETDWHWTIAREEAHGDVLGFLHTHPAGCGTTPSSRDRQTMQAWCQSFGKPLLCLIRDRRKVSAWMFRPGSEETREVKVEQIKYNHFQVFPSYGSVVSDGSVLGAERRDEKILEES